MTNQGPDGRMVPTTLWRTHSPTNRDVGDWPSNPIFKTSCPKQFGRCSDRIENVMARLETVQPERKQTPGSKDLWRTRKCVLRPDRRLLPRGSNPPGARKGRSETAADRTSRDGRGCPIRAGRRTAPSRLTRTPNGCLRPIWINDDGRQDIVPARSGSPLPFRSVR